MYMYMYMYVYVYEMYMHISLSSLAAEVATPQSHLHAYQCKPQTLSNECSDMV